MLEPSLDRLRHGETQGLRPTDDRCRHVTKEQFKQIVKEIIRDIKLRSSGGVRAVVAAEGRPN